MLTKLFTTRSSTARSGCPVRHRRPRHARRHPQPDPVHPQHARRHGRADVGIDWHGHNDRGLGVVNAIFAIEYGADRIHGTALGIGERVGNAALDQILLNLKLLGELPDQDLTNLVQWCRTRRRDGVADPRRVPAGRRDAFRTATGVHAAAIIKAEKKGDAVARRPRSTPACPRLFGKRAGDRDRPLLGRVERRLLAASKRGIEPTPPLVAALLAAAKRGDHVLTDAEVHAVIQEFPRSGHPGQPREPPLTVAV
jgi:2-isopropylmalate synthase